MLENAIIIILDWFKITIRLQNKKPQLLFKEGEIWWCSIGMNIGVEIFGKDIDFGRPVIIFKKINANSFLGIPLTTQPKEDMWHIPFIHADRKQYGIFSQIRTLDSKRLINKMGSLSPENLNKIKGCFAKLYVPENTHPVSPSEERERGAVGNPNSTQ